MARPDLLLAAGGRLHGFDHERAEPGVELHLVGGHSEIVDEYALGLGELTSAVLALDADAGTTAGEEQYVLPPDAQPISDGDSATFSVAGSSVGCESGPFSGELVFTSLEGNAQQACCR